VGISRLGLPGQESYGKVYVGVRKATPNSRARKGGKERGNLRGGGECLLIGNSAPQSAACCTMCKRVSVGIGHERFEKGGSILGRNPGRGYTGWRRSPTL